MLTKTWPATAAKWAGLLAAMYFLEGCGQGAAVTGNSAADPTGSTTAPATLPASSPPAPTFALTGTPPATVTAGSDYSFQPSVSASSGTVTFSITGQPAWATFNAGTGELSGTPTESEVGTTRAITITASDGGSSASIEPFTVQINTPTAAPPPAAGSASLSWNAPTENTDGSPVTDLVGFHIYYGTSADALTQTIDVPATTTTTYVIGDLDAGTYYFAVTAYTAQGTESAQSNVASKTI